MVERRWYILCYVCICYNSKLTSIENNTIRMFTYNALHLRINLISDNISIIFLYRQFPVSAILLGGRKRMFRDEPILIVAGGFHQYSKSLQTRVESYEGFGWDHDKVAPLPETISNQCLVRLNDSHLLSVGGSVGWPLSGNETTNSYFYNILSNQWSKGPNLIHPRMSQSCAILTHLSGSAETEERMVIVAGGQFDDERLQSVEILFLDSNVRSSSRWYSGPNLPDDGAIHKAMVSTGDSVVLVSGSSLYKLSGKF
jgi:hypothetical protein